MGNSKLDNSNISKHLGQSSQYKSTYDKELLVREPRSNNREYLNIFDDALPFVGSDTWNAYECSFLLKSGRPVTGIVKCVYSCSSKYIVESKSIKLYFNSFNMTKLGDETDTAVKNFEEITAKDLTELLGTDVVISFHSGERVNKKFSSPGGEWDIEDYVNVDLLETKDYTFEKYTESPELLEGVKQSAETEQQFYSGLLKSNFSARLG